MAHSSQDFVAAVLREFPELREDLTESGGLPHHEVGEFAAFTQAAKGRGDLGTYERCVTLVDGIYAGADAALAAAIRGSYLEHLDFEGSRGPAAWQLMPPRLQAAWNQVSAENRRLMALPQKSAKPQQGTKPQQPKGKHKRETPRRHRRR